MASARSALRAQDVDPLREIANIGAGHSMTALSELTGKTFTMSVPDVGLTVARTADRVLGDLESEAAAVYMPVGGDAPGHAAFVFPYADACALADLVLAQPVGVTRRMGDIEESALTEVGNILISSFLNALAGMTGLRLSATPPGFAQDMTGAILECIASVSLFSSEQALTIRTRLREVGWTLEGAFIYIPEPESVPVLMHALGMDE